MKQIKFSKEYPKLWGQTKARLVAVILIDAASIGQDLLDYDTKDIKGEYYMIPRSGYLLQLIFVGNKGIPFCTLRRHTPEKETYYRDLMGHNFEIIRTFQ